MTAVLVVGLGHPDRGDDAVGWHVVQAVARRYPDLPVRTLLDPAGLLDLGPGVAHVVVVDAVREPDRLGRVRVLDASDGLDQTPSGTMSSHGLGLADVLTLGRSTDVLPARVSVVAVAGGRWQAGEPPQEQVEAAVEEAVDVVVGLVGLGGPSDS